MARSDAHIKIAGEEIKLCERLTFVICIFVLYCWNVWSLETVKTEVSDLQNPSTIHKTVGRSQVAMATNIAFVQIYHTLQTTI